MKYFSMFSGIGGFELGIESAYQKCENLGESVLNGRNSSSPSSEQGWNEQPECVGFSEIDKYAIKIYESHFGGHKNYGDATRIVPEELPDFDLLVGGFPCQAFSIAGKRLGFDDTRGTLFFDIARILKVKRPRMFLLENVKGLLSHDNGRTFKTIITTLAELGYGVEWQIINSKNHGVPQNRERVFIVGHLGDFCGREVFPIGEGDGAVGACIKRIAHNDIFRRYNQTYDPKGSVEALDTMQGGGHQPCVPCAYGFKVRRLTPTECERLQGYPDGWTARGLSSIMDICVNINPAIENLSLKNTASCTISVGANTELRSCQKENKESARFVIDQLVPDSYVTDIINHGKGMAIRFNQSETSNTEEQTNPQNTKEEKADQPTLSWLRVLLVGSSKKEKLSTILISTPEIMRQIICSSVRIDDNIIGVIILLNSSEPNYSSVELSAFNLASIESISDTQRYKTLGNSVTVNVIEAIMSQLLSLGDGGK